MKALLLGLAATMAIPSLAESINHHPIRIFGNNFESALYRAEANRILLFCTFEGEQTSFHSMDCLDAVKYAIETKLKYKAIFLKLILKIEPEHDIMSLDTQIDAALERIDPQWPLDKVAREIVQSAVSIGKNHPK